jgi:pyrimidine deaminase RibD-like protein
VLSGPGVPDPPGRQGRRVAELPTLDGADCPRYPARSAVSRALLRQPGHGSPTLVGFGKKVVWAGRSQRACAQASTVASGVGRTRTARDASARVLLEPNEAFARSSFCRFSRVSSSEGRIVFAIEKAEQVSREGESGLRRAGAQLGDLQFGLIQNGVALADQLDSSLVLPDRLGQGQVLVLQSLDDRFDFADELFEEVDRVWHRAVRLLGHPVPLSFAQLDRSDDRLSLTVAEVKAESLAETDLTDGTDELTTGTVLGQEVTPS